MDLKSRLGSGLLVSAIALMWYTAALWTSTASTPRVSRSNGPGPGRKCGQGPVRSGAVAPLTRQVRKRKYCHPPYVLRFARSAAERTYSVRKR